MSAFVMSASRVAPMVAKVGGLGFRKAVAAVRMPVQPKAPVARAVSMEIVAGKPGAKAKTRKAAAKRFKITASGKVRAQFPWRHHSIHSGVVAAGWENHRSWMSRRPQLRRETTRFFVLFFFFPALHVKDKTL